MSKFNTPLVIRKLYTNEGLDGLCASNYAGHNQYLSFDEADFGQIFYQDIVERVVNTGSLGLARHISEMRYACDTTAPHSGVNCLL